MKIVAVIPARMASSRFPGKPIAKLAGLPMIQHVWARARMCKKLDAVYVATCDEQIRDVARSFGAEAIMTSDRHERASDRMAEVAGSVQADVYVLIQGDEPMIRPSMIDLALEPLERDASVVCSNLAAPIHSEEEFMDRNTVKVVMDLKGDALYFSRSPLPYPFTPPFRQVRAFKQVCIIPFRAGFLHTYTRLSPTPLEMAESIDMLRALEHGFPVRLVECYAETHSVDTAGDLARVEALMREDSLLPSYSSGGRFGRSATE